MTHLPGPLMRRAVSATVQEGITREKSNIKGPKKDPLDYAGGFKQQKAAGKRVIRDLKEDIPLGV